MTGEMQPRPEEFRDPLSDYSRQYDDELERSLKEDPAAAIESQPFIAIEPQTPIIAAMKLMDERDVACVVVVDEERKPLGVFTERDVLDRVADRFAEMGPRPVIEVMTPRPVVVYESDTPARVLNLMNHGLFRHLPVVDVDGRLTGIIGARRVTAYLQKFFSDVPSA